MEIKTQKQTKHGIKLKVEPQQYNEVHGVYGKSYVSLSSFISNIVRTL